MPYCCWLGPISSIAPTPQPPSPLRWPVELQPATLGMPDGDARVTCMKVCAGRSVDPQPPAVFQAKLPCDACATVGPDHAPASLVFHGSNIHGALPVSDFSALIIPARVTRSCRIVALIMRR